MEETNQNTVLIETIKNYQGYSRFMHSLKQQALSDRILSDAQLKVAMKIISEQNTPPQAPQKEFTLKVGQVVRIGGGYGRILAKNLQLEAPIFNMEILSVEDERPNSWKVTVRGSGTVNGYCGCCGLPLTDIVSINANIGPVCAKRRGIVRDDSLAMRKIVTMMLEKVVSTQSFWLSKRMVKGVTG